MINSDYKLNGSKINDSMLGGKIQIWITKLGLGSLLALSVAGVVFTFVTLCHLTTFLSGFSSMSSSLPVNTTSESIGESYVFRAIVTDSSLLSIFMIFHSSILPFQDVLTSIFHLPVLSRTIINFLTSASLQLLIRTWKPIPQYTLWTINQEENAMVFLGAHVTSWLLIYVMMITMDITDLMGIKQVSNFITGRPAPGITKSAQLKRLHSNMRHPSFLAFTIIFWIFPVMRLDRFLLAGVWTVYMLLCWKPDVFDYNYIKEQQLKKKAVIDTYSAFMPVNHQLHNYTY